MADTRTEGLQYRDLRTRDTGLAMLQIASTRQHCKPRRYHFLHTGQALALAMHSKCDYRLTVSLGEALGRAFTFCRQPLCQRILRLVQSGQHSALVFDHSTFNVGSPCSTIARKRPWSNKGCRTEPPAAQDFDASVMRPDKAVLRTPKNIASETRGTMSAIAAPLSAVAAASWRSAR